MILAGRTRVYVCCGSDCRKQVRANNGLWTALAEHGEIVEVPCQKICKGPVLGLEVKGKLQWFSKVRGKKKIKAVARLLYTGKCPSLLRKRRVKKRAGKLRGVE